MPGDDGEVSRLLKTLCDNEEQRANVTKNFLVNYMLIGSEVLEDFSEGQAKFTEKMQQIDIVGSSRPAFLLFPF